MIEQLAKAIAKVEGFGAKADNRSTRNNNPGNLEYHDWLVHKYSVLGTDGRFAIFATPDDGWKALIDILSGPNYHNLTVQQIVTKWNGSNEINNSIYCKLVCKLTGFNPTDVPSTDLVNKLVNRNKQLTQSVGLVKAKDRSVL